MTQKIPPSINGHLVNPWPLVTVLIVTYNRPKIIRRVINGYKEHIQYGGPLVWRLADDGSPEGYLEDLAADFPELDLKWTVTDRKGLGSNINKGLRACETKYILFTEDDWMPVRAICLERPVTLLENVPQVAVVSFDIVAYHMTLRAHLLKVNGGFVRYFVIDHETSKFWYPGHPHLMTPSFHEAYGMYEEGVGCFGTESTFVTRAKQIKNGPEVAILPGYLGRLPYKHIGFPRLKGSENDAGKQLQGDMGRWKKSQV